MTDSSNDKKDTPHINVIPMLVGDLMKKNYLNYAVSVIMDRALPDVRDGLKPVHRRILYSMYELGMMPGTAYKKSARMVGEVMGKYHPHGDSSIYEAAVYMAQPWSKRVPLIDGQGNFGSMDGDSAAAMRYCFKAGTRVMTSKGLIKIEELVSQQELSSALSNENVHSYVPLDIQVESSKGGKNASKWIYSGKQDTVKLVTTNGYETTCTPNEPFLVLNEKLEYVWVDVKDLKIGDKICMSGKESQLDIASSQDLTHYYTQLDNDSAKVYQLPKKMSKELAHILGSIVSDGCVRPVTNEIIFASSDNESFNKFLDCFKKVFPDALNYKVKELKDNPNSFQSNKICNQFSISSAHLFRFLVSIGYKGWDSYNVSVPEIIFKSSKEEVSAFLQSYFDGDGSIYGIKTQTTISASSANKELLTDIKLLLINYFGIISGKIISDRQHYRFLITQYSQITEFKKHIGFISDRKNMRLNESEESTKGSPSSFDIVPNFNEYNREFIKSNQVSARKYSNDDGVVLMDNEMGCVSLLRQSSNTRYKVKKVLDLVMKSQLHSNWKLLSNKLQDIKEREYFYATVESITPEINQAVFDLTVPETHAFVANGFIVHNTEARLTKAGAAFFEDIDKETVEFRENYDGHEHEPEVLPVSYPNIWVNGVEGIAVGMATYLPPHNLNETVDVTLALQKNPDLTIEEVLEIMPAPDFPTGGIVHDLDGFRNALLTGKGLVRVRSKWHSEKEKNGQELLVLDELPFKVNKKTLVESIIEKVTAKIKDPDLEEIVDVNDESNKEGVRVVISLKKGAIPAVVFNHLVKKTEVESSYNYNVMLLQGQSPKQMGLIEILSKFLEFRAEVITKRVTFDLNKDQNKLHILSGMMIVLARIQEAIAIITENKDGKSANLALQTTFNIDEIQAKSILDLRLQRLTAMELDAIKNEFYEVTARVEDMKDILAKPIRVQEILRKDLISAKERFGDVRRTEVSYENNEINMSDLVKKEPCLIHVTKNGYLKRMPLADMESQKRNGKGRMGIQTGDDDYVEAIYAGSTHDIFMVFTKSGKAMSSRVWKLPDGTTAQKGRHLRNIFESLNEPIANLLLIPEIEEGLSVITVTAKGKVKRTELSNYTGTLRKKGVQGVSIDEDDSLVSVFLAKQYDHLILVTSTGKAARFEISDDVLQTRGRKSVGVKGINVGNAKVIGAMVINSNSQKLPTKTVERARVIDGADVTENVIEYDTSMMDEGKYLLCVGENGVGKRTPVSEFTPHSRGTKGVNCFNINEKTGSLVKVALVTEEEDIMMTTATKTIRIKVADIRLAGRNTAGTMLMNVGKEKLIDVIQVPQEEVVESLDSLELLTEKLHDDVIEANNEINITIEDNSDTDNQETLKQDKE